MHHALKYFEEMDRQKMHEIVVYSAKITRYLFKLLW